jgi:hypothetical protein
MKVGQYLNHDGSMWIVHKIVPDENQRFRWLQVFVTWSGIGRSPLWPKEPRRFLMDRRRKCDGSLV